MQKGDDSGFTLVEILIVVVIIGILSAIVLVAYNNVSKSARDSVRKQDLANVSKALKMYYLDHGDYITQGGGSGNGDGWFNDPGQDVPVEKTILQSLQSSGLLVGSDIKDPKCGIGTYDAVCPGYIKANCIQGGEIFTIMMTQLETLPKPQPAPSVLSNCGGGGLAVSWWDTNQMNYFVEIH